ncbi:SPOR domain-containing protein [Agaribacter flavus]|uniref:SPOR domain-containing protein n=1 Tax=Agaribacter flavus TaxID=1902781 RepID=A0ABV7FRM3_9ALTE
MSPQDYVRRGHAKKSSAKKNNKTKPHQTPWFRICVAALLLFAFGFGLYYLQTKPLNTNTSEESALTETSASSPKSKDVTTTKKAAEVLPVLKEEEWTFIDSLPEYSVEVEIETLPESDKKYIMQCFSVRSIERAEALRAKIALQGLEAKVVESNGNNGHWYRVVLGPYDRKRAAEKDRHQLKRANIPGCIIW